MYQDPDLIVDPATISTGSYNDFEAISSNPSYEPSVKELQAYVLDDCPQFPIQNVASEVHNNVVKVYDEIAKKYNVDLNYADFKNLLSDIVELDPQQLLMVQASNAKLLDWSVATLKTKMIVALTKTVSATLDKVEQLQGGELNPVEIGMIGQMLGWITQLDMMASRNPIKDPDRILDSASKKLNKEEVQSKDADALEQDQKILQMLGL